LTSGYPQTQFFQTFVDVGIDDRLERVWIKPQAENVFTFDAAAEPKLVNFDYEGTIFKELNFEKPADELVYQMLNDKDIIGRRWAMDELSKTAAGDDVSDADKAKIVTAIVNALETDKSFRIKRAAVSELASVLIERNQSGLPTGTVKFDDATAAALIKAAKNENALLRGDAVELLGYSADPKHAPVYLSALDDRSYYVIDRASVALAKTKDKRAFDAFQKLVKTPSWKGRIQIAGMEGLSELGDKRALETAFKYAQDANQPVAVQSAALKIIGAEGKGDPRAFPLIFESFKIALDNNDFQALFDTTTAIIRLADPRGQEAFDMLKTKFKDNPQLNGYITFMETQFKEGIGK
jgi:aminopeptidase N